MEEEMIPCEVTGPYETRKPESRPESDRADSSIPTAGGIDSLERQSDRWWASEGSGMAKKADKALIDWSVKCAPDMVKEFEGNELLKKSRTKIRKRTAPKARDLPGGKKAVRTLSKLAQSQAVRRIEAFEAGKKRPSPPSAREAATDEHRIADGVNSKKQKKQLAVHPVPQQTGDVVHSRTHVEGTFRSKGNFIAQANDACMYRPKERILPPVLTDKGKLVKGGTLPPGEGFTSMQEHLALVESAPTPDRLKTTLSPHYLVPVGSKLSRPPQALAAIL